MNEFNEIDVIKDFDSYLEGCGLNDDNITKEVVSNYISSLYYDIWSLGLDVSDSEEKVKRIIYENYNVKED